MEEQASLEDLVIPVHTNTFAIPNDRHLRLVHEVYKPSAEAVKVQRGRTIYPEVFIENYNLGTLADLSARSLARAYGPDPLPMIGEDPLKVQTHYDALDVDLPLEKCYHISNERFWRRVVLNKHPDKTLALQPNVNWKNLGISLKYTEMVENCPAEYWPEEEMSELAKKVEEFVTEIHIKRLQSLTERSFEIYYRPQATTSSEEDEESIEEVTESSIPTSEEEPAEFLPITGEVKTDSQLALEQQLVEEKAKRKHDRQILRESRANARREREERRLRREARRLEKEQPLEKPKKKKKKQPNSIYEIELSESEDDGEQFIIDHRNKELYLKHKRGYNYPPEHCHHIDLKFVQYFKNLNTFTIEFLGPIQGRNYHHRHMNFSQEDIKRLALGLGQLPQLRIFRLRNSRMDAEKILTLIRALKAVESLETLDFGYNNLGEDCSSAFYELFEDSSNIRNLELESNNFNENVLRTLGESLHDLEKGRLEYLGLSRNPITDEALHALVSNILGTPHISSLSLRGLPYITDQGLICCIAQELLRKHISLEKLDLTAIPISGFAANELLKSLDLNQKLLNLECLACGLDEESQVDIAVLLKRNKYIAENPYVGDQTKTDEDIDDWLNRTKNPILLKVLAEREESNECLLKKSKEFIPSPQPSRTHSQETFKLETYGSMYEHTSFSSEHNLQVARKDPFEYKANEFDEKEFLEHIYLPGPPNRYYYFKNLRE